MASLKYSANSSLQTVTLGSAYTAGSGSMTLTSGEGSRLPATGDYWLTYNDGAGTVRIFKVTARSTDTLTVVADSTEGNGDANIASGETLTWALTVSALNQLKADIVAAGSLVLLETQTASSSASLNFASSISSSYDTYKIEIVNLVPATDNQALLMRFSTNGGTSYDSSSIYDTCGFRFNAGGQATFGGNSQAYFGIVNSTSNTGTQGGACASLTLQNPLSSSLWKGFTGQACDYENATTASAYSLGGYYRSTTAVNAFQFFFASGNIASGTIRVYGVAK